MQNTPKTPVEKAKSALSGAPDTRFVEDRPVIKNNLVYCCKCKMQIGEVQNDRNLKSGSIIVINRTPVRCAVCFKKQRWTPLRP